MAGRWNRWTRHAITKFLRILKGNTEHSAAYISCSELKTKHDTFDFFGHVLRPFAGQRLFGCINAREEIDELIYSAPLW